MDKLQFEYQVSITSTGRASVNYKITGDTDSIKDSDLDEMRTRLREKALLEYGRINMELSKAHNI